MLGKGLTLCIALQVLAPHGRAGQIQDDDGPKNELLQNGQPIEDDGYDNPGMAFLTLCGPATLFV